MKVRTENYEVVAGNGRSKWLATFETQYDREGKVMTYATYDQQGHLRYLDSPAYDQHRHRLDIQYHFGEQKGQILFPDHIYFSYDSIGRRQKAMIYYDSLRSAKDLYFYGDSDYCLEKLQFNNDTSLAEHHFYRWDRRGNCISDSSVLRYGTWQYLYRYNELSLPVSETYINKTTISTDTMFYDSHGNVSRVERYDGPARKKPEEIYETRYVYDSHGNWIERHDLINGKAKRSSVRRVWYYK